MTAANTMKDQRSLYLCKSLCCLTLVLNCAQMIKTYISLNQDNEFFFLEITCLQKDKLGTLVYFLKIEKHRG